MRPSNRYVGFGLATISGCLWFVACPPFDVSALAWIAALPMLLAIDRAPTLRTALFLGWWAGVVETGGGFYWLIDLMQRFAGFPWIAAALVFFVFCAARALIFLIFTALVCSIRRRRRVPMALLAPLGMAIGELVVPQVFPCGQWISQAWHPLVIQITELTGPLGVTALLMMVNGAVFDLVTKDRMAVRSAVGAAALLAAALLFGFIRMRQVDALVAHAPRLSIGLVQPNFAYSVDGEFSRDEAVRELTALQEQSHRLEQEGAQLIVWSEGAYPVTLPRDFAADFSPRSLGMIRRGFSTPVVIGTDTYQSELDDAYNSALLLDHEGKAVGRYDKVRLLAFGEYMPGIETFPWLRNMLPAGTGKFTAGAGPSIMSLQTPASGTWRLGPVICYEDLLPGFLRRVGELHPDILVNLTSDSWFGARTEPWEHLALAVFGTIELRVSMVRSVNSGVSAMIDPNGRLLSKTYANDPYREPRGSDGIVVSAPKMPGGYTLYVAWGNWFPYLCMIVMGTLLGLAFRGVGSPARTRDNALDRPLHEQP
jgi:apolipoprotein N-acyltransferase